MPNPIRRIVTGHDDTGKAIIEMDGPSPNAQVRPGTGLVSTLVWATDETPARMDLRADRADRTMGVPPPPNGSVLRVVDFPPVTPEAEAMDQSEILKTMGAEHHAANGQKARHAFMHRTKSVDYAFVLEGEIDMLLDDSEVHMKAGDIMVQQGTNHAWVNRSDRVCRIAFVLIDAHDPLDKLGGKGIMKFGVFDHLDRGDAPLGELYENRLRLAEVYDREGFHAYHIAEHHSTPLGTASAPSVFLAALAQRTKRLRFGPLVYTLSLSHPLRILEEICMLDQMSNGRLEVGVGRGSSPYEMGYFGVTPQDSGKLYTEGYAVIMQGLQSREINFEGERYVFKNVPVELECVQKPHPPIWYGVSQPNAVPWVAQQGFNIVCNGPAAPVKAITETYRKEWAAAHPADGALPFLGLGRHIVVADSSKEAYDLGKRGFDRWYASLQHLWKLHGNPMTSYSIPGDYAAAFDAGIVLAGTPQEVADGLRREIDKAGVNYVLTRFAFGDLSFEESLNSLTLFARHVMPQF